MKIYKYILILFPLFSFAQTELIGDYTYKLTFERTDIFRDFNLKIKADSTFVMTKYVYEVCYDYTDTLNGKWKVVNEKLSFCDIDQPKYISKTNEENIDRNEILVKEKCVFSYMSKDSIGIKLLVLDSNY